MNDEDNNKEARSDPTYNTDDAGDRPSHTQKAQKEEKVQALVSGRRHREEAERKEKERAGGGCCRGCVGGQDSS